MAPALGACRREAGSASRRWGSTPWRASLRGVVDWWRVRRAGPRRRRPCGRCRSRCPNRGRSPRGRGLRSDCGARRRRFPRSAAAAGPRRTTRSPFWTYSATASACLAQQTTVCQSVWVSPSPLRRSVASRSWTTAVPPWVWRSSGSAPTRPSSSIRLIVRDIGGAPFKSMCGRGTAAPVKRGSPASLLGTRGCLAPG